tara:strand:+ start:927 stop:2027 length:1101 start_codon:yes stop_codon:yes gene_type:complete
MSEPLILSDKLSYLKKNTNEIVNNLNVEKISKLITPKELEEYLPVSNKILKFVKKTRDEISDILNGFSQRKIIVVGPCSIHNIEVAKEYAIQLKKISDKVKDKILIVMRVYFEKPRTTVGWKGLINDPDLNNTFNINKGLKMARELLIFLNENEIPCGYEILDTFTPQYIGELISWGAIGARTTESQVHRQLVSGLSMPVGFKNNSSGDYKIAAEAIISAKHPHCFYGIDKDGQASIVKTNGNNNCHIILRGSKYGTNYKKQEINLVKDELLLSQLRINIMVDCSHGNSRKNYKNQPKVFHYLINEMHKNSKFIMGMMLESNLVKGKQKLIFGEADKLEWGKSITDCCIDIKTTEELIVCLYENLD